MKINTIHINNPYLDKVGQTKKQNIVSNKRSNELVAVSPNKEILKQTQMNGVKGTILDIRV